MAILWKEAVLRLFHNGFYDVFSPITTERLLIRKLAIGDAEDIFKVSSDQPLCALGYPSFDCGFTQYDPRGAARLSL